MAVGAVAAAVAGVLLVGGQGTFAYWTSSQRVPGGTLTAGSLSLEPSPGCTAWTFNQTGGPSTWVGTTYPAATTNASGSAYVEPNDTLTATCTYTLKAVGDHLRANLTVTQPTISVTGVSAAGVTATASYTLNGATVTSVTSAQNGATVVGTIRLVIPSSVAATSPGGIEGVSFTVIGAGVTLTQVHP